MICEMCGTEVPRTKLVMVEGAAVGVCQRCEKFASSPAVKTKDGAVVLPDVAERLDTREKRRKERDIYEPTGEKELAVDYSQRIRVARQKLGMNQEELGRLINEKKGVIVNIENGTMIPNDKLIGTLERTLKISLREVVEDSGEIKKAEYSRGLTLGDFIKTEKKK
ncbi:MAG: TIGR00270 family protein [Candidatus Thermoplasmatota archaeon]|nr:TIGR00270 family protein [Candidatus Thermoplasmatota archaeon]MBU4070875.1 TIGR00270 family protein [Candidatus Thermoplasmatota archaeon]MBU4143575.1 TIGR00270 family protein [Candidatus Thermoplasmatota archaeon]MBU4591762.1 TIGR00270 family protein [Candidatus Thermoplasmatota archaeon]